MPKFKTIDALRENLRLDGEGAETKIRLRYAECFRARKTWLRVFAIADDKFRYFLDDGEMIEISRDEAERAFKYAKRG